MPIIRPNRLIILFPLLLFAGETFSMNVAGFASIGLGKIDRDDTGVMAYDGNWSGRATSTFGVQLNSSLSDNLLGTAQLISKAYVEDGRSEFEPLVDWFFLSYQPTPDIQYRIGRLRSPLYMFSDSIEVGYSYTWVQPPLDVYDPILMMFSNFDGVDISLFRDFGNNAFEWNLYAGRQDKERNGFRIDAKVLLGTSFTVNTDHLTLHYGISFSRADQIIDSVTQLRNAFQGFAGFDPIFAQIADSLESDDATYQYHSLGVIWEPDNWTAISELNWLKAPDEGFSVDKAGWYASLTREINAFKPYVVVGYSRYNLINSDSSKLTIQSESIVPTGISPQLDFLRQGLLLAQEQTDLSGYSGTVGCRYDFHDNIALKVEFQYFNSTIPVTEPTLVPNDRDLYISSIVLDMVF